MSRPWTRDTPGAGDTGTMRSQAAEWETKAYQMHELRTRAVSVLAETGPDAWSGQAADAWRTRVEQTAGELASFAQQLMDRSTALAVYASAVELVAEESHLWRLRLEEPEHRVQARRALDRLGEERRGLDTRVCGSLAPVRVGSWSSTAAGLHLIGVHEPGHVEARDVAVGLSTWARGFDGRLSERDVEELTALLRAWSPDPEAMGAFFAALGARGTLDLLAAVAGATHLPEDELLDLAAMIRSGLAVGSATWERLTAEGFAAGLIDPLADPTRSEHDRVRDLWSVSFLLGDATVQPMGEGLAVALADRVDLIERTRAQDAIWQHVPTPSMAGVPDTAALVGLTVSEDPARPYAGTRPDVAGLVLEHLGGHPDAALAWLSSTAPDVDGAGEAGPRRIAYWFGRRDWAATYDGFAGPTALWRGAMNATGGPADPDGCDADAWLQVATAMSAITAAIVGNPAFLPENTSVVAEVNLAGVLAAQMPCLTEVPVGEGAGRARGDVELNHFPGLDDPRWVASLDREQLMILLGVATSSPAGLEVTRAVISAMQDALLGAAGTGSGYPPDAAIERAVTLQALLDAAPAGAAAGAQARYEAKVEAAIDTISLGLSMIRIPGLDRSVSSLATAAADVVPPGVTTAVAHKAAAEGRSWLLDQAAGAWEAAYLDAQARAESTDDALDAARGAVATWAEQLQVPEIDTTAGGEVDEYVRQKMSGYAELSTALEDYAEQQRHD